MAQPIEDKASATHYEDLKGGDAHQVAGRGSAATDA
jgi:hypothetical protein